MISGPIRFWTTWRQSSESQLAQTSANTGFLQILFDDGVARFRCADQWIAVQREKRIATPIREKHVASSVTKRQVDEPRRNLLPARLDAVVLHFLNVPATLTPNSLAKSSCVLCRLSVRAR